MILLLALSSALATPPECQEPRSTSELQVAVSQATLSFLAADLSGYEASRTAAWDTLGCVDAVLTGQQVTALHQLAALDGFYERKDVLRDGALRALSDVEGYRLPEAFGSSHPLRVSWEEVREIPNGDVTTLSVPERDILLLNGGVSLEWPSDRTVVVQVLDPVGQVQRAWLAAPGDPVPAYAVGDEAAREAYLAREVRVRRRPVPVLVTSVVMASAAAGLYGLSAAERSRFWDPSTPTGELEGARIRNNAFVVGAGAAGGVSLALGLTAAVTW